MLFLWISSHSIVAREFPIRPSQRKSNQGIYNNVKYVDVNFILPCTDNAEGPVYNEMSYFRLFFFFLENCMLIYRITSNLLLLI